MKIRIKAFTILLLMIVLALPKNVSAYEIHDDVFAPSAHVIVDSYSISNERIIPGAPFVLTLVIKNASTSARAIDTLVEISNPSGVSPKYGKVSEFYLGTLEPNTSQTIELEYDSWTSITSDTVDFYVTIATLDRNHTTTLRVPAGTEEPFSVLSLDIPTTGTQAESISTSLTFKVLGEDNVKDVAYIVKVDGEETVNSSIGIMKPGATKTSAAAFNIMEEGQHVIEVSLKYADEAGREHFMEVGKQAITIEKGTVTPAEANNPDYIGGNTTSPNYVGMGACAAVIVLLFFTFVIILKKK